MIANIFKFAWRNLKRNTRRTFFTLIAIAVGVMALIFARSYIAGIINNASESVIKTQTGHIRIAHEEYLRLERIMPREYMINDLEQLEKGISSIPGVRSQDRRIKFNVLLSRGTVNEAAVATGIDPAEADKNMELSSVIVDGGYFGGSEENRGLELIIGGKLAEKLNAAVNDELLLVTTDINYSTYALPFKVAGIFETGFSYMDKHMLYIPLSRAREMLDCGDAAHEILVFVDRPADSIKIGESIEKILAAKDPGQTIQVIPWQKSDFAESIPTITGIFNKILGIIMFIVALVILNTMLMSVMERYHEIGVIKALGFKNREVFAMILVEAFYLGAIGSVIGGIFGGTLSAVIEKVGFDVSKWGGGFIDKIDVPVPFIGKVLYPDFSASILIGSLLFGIAAALLAVLYPAVKSSRMQPVEAFRSQLKV
jgi:putative ABC transport system permease protein